MRMFFGIFCLIVRASDGSREKKLNFAGFSGAKLRKKLTILREISPENFAEEQSAKDSQFRWIFFGKFR